MKFSSKVFLMLIIATFQQNSIHAVPFRDLKESAKNKVSLVRSKIDSGYNKTKQFIKNNPKKLAATAAFLWTYYGYCGLNNIDVTVISTHDKKIIKFAEWSKSNCSFQKKLIPSTLFPLYKLSSHLHTIVCYFNRTCWFKINEMVGLKAN